MKQKTNVKPLNFKQMEKENLEKLHDIRLRLEDAIHFLEQNKVIVAYNYSKIVLDLINEFINNVAIKQNGKEN